MKELTLKELKQEIDDLIAQGYGDYPVVAQDDNEGNGYHGVFCSATVVKESEVDAKEISMLSSLLGDTNVTDITKCVIIG